MYKLPNILFPEVLLLVYKSSKYKGSFDKSKRFGFICQIYRPKCDLEFLPVLCWWQFYCLVQFLCCSKYYWNGVFKTRNSTSESVICLQLYFTLLFSSVNKGLKKDITTCVWSSERQISYGTCGDVIRVTRVRRRCSARAAWNSLPKTVINSDFVTVFKSMLKTFLSSQAFCLSTSQFSLADRLAQHLWSYDLMAL